MRLTRAILLLITIMIASSGISAESIVLAPASTTVDPEHASYLRISTLEQLQTESDTRQGWFEVWAYPGLYDDQPTLTLSDVGLRGVSQPVLLATGSHLNTSNTCAVIHAHITLQGRAIVSSIVADSTGISDAPAIQNLDDCQSSRVYRNDIRSNGIGIFSDPPSNSSDDDPYFIGWNIITDCDVAIWLGSGHRSGYDPVNGSVGGYSTVTRNQLIDNGVGIYCEEGADSIMGIPRYEGFNFFDGNAYHLVLERDPLSPPFLMPAIGNEWYDSAGSLITTTTTLAPYIRIEDSGGSPFGSLEDYIDTGLPSSKPLPFGPKNPNKLDRTIEPQSSSRVSTRG